MKNKTNTNTKTKNYNPNLMFSSELTTNENNVRYGNEKILVRLYPSTIQRKTMTASALILEGLDKNKLTTIYLNKGLYSVDTNERVYRI